MNLNIETIKECTDTLECMKADEIRNEPQVDDDINTLTTERYKQKCSNFEMI